MKGQRIEYLDSLKAISILLVVFCHYVLLSQDTIIGNIVMALAWSAVPCFIMISGGLMHRNEIFSWKKHLLRIVKVYLSLVIWKGVYLAVYLFIADFVPGKTEVLQYLLFFSDLPQVDTGLMWYMHSYLAALLIFPATHHLFFSGEQGQKILIFLMTIIMFFGIVIPSIGKLISMSAETLDIQMIDINGIDKISPFSNYIMLFYFILGAFLLKHTEKIREKLSSYKYVPLLLIFIGLSGLIVVKFYQTKSLAWKGIYISSGYSHIMTTVLSLGMYLIFVCFDFKRLNRFLGIIGRNTMGVYYMHYILLAVCNIFLYPSLHNYYSFSLNCLKTLLVTGICVIMTELIRKIPYVKELVQ